MKLEELVVTLGIALAFTGLTPRDAKAQNDLEVAIAEVFGTDMPAMQDADNMVSCECVPFYLCKNETEDEHYGEDVIDIRFGESGCAHYLEKCCPLDNTHLKPPPTPKPLPKDHKCGTRHGSGIGFKITGGTDNEANYGEFPWMVALLRRDHVDYKVSLKVMECGGSIIHPQLVLTAAHCVKGKKDLFVRAGEWDTQTDKELYPTQDKNVKEVIIHEEYYAGGLHNDIALLWLESPLELNEVVDTVCLPDQGENMDGRNCLVSGWGKNIHGKEGKYQAILKRVEQPVFPRTPCQCELRKTYLGAHFKLHKSFICAGGQVGKDACKGDGGGPLVCPTKNNPDLYVQAGIVAWGIGCGSKTPAVYVNVPHFRTWIDEKMAAIKLI